jgi:hypothetical protein
MISPSVFIGGLMAAAITLLLLSKYFRKKRENSKETREIEKERTVKRKFTRTYATLTFIDGETREITYDDRENVQNNPFTKFITFTPDCFFVIAKDFSTGPIKPRVSLNKANVRQINLSNVKEFEIKETEQYIAEADIELVIEQERVRDSHWKNSWYNNVSNFSDAEFTIEKC